MAEHGPRDTRLATLTAPRAVLMEVDPIIGALSRAERQGFLLFDRRYRKDENSLEVEGASGEYDKQIVNQMWKEICKKQGRPRVVATLTHYAVRARVPTMVRTRPIWVWMNLCGVEAKHANDGLFLDAMGGKGDRPVFVGGNSTMELCVPAPCVQAFWVDGFAARAREDWRDILKPFGDKRDLPRE